jgi:hypothetical protein
MSDDLRLPLDILLTCDAEYLEEALLCRYAIEHEGEIFFCRDEKNLLDMKYEMELADDFRHYIIDEIENDRIQAVIDLLSHSEENSYISHLIDRLVR